MIRKVLFLAVLVALAFFIARRWNEPSPVPTSEPSRPYISPEESKRLVEQALAQPRETVRFRFEPSTLPPSPAPLPSPTLAPAAPPPPPPTLTETPPAPPPPAAEVQQAMEHRNTVIKNLRTTLEKVAKASRPFVGSNPAAPVPDPTAVPPPATPPSPTPAAP